MFSSVRKRPVNLVDADLYLFEHELEKQFPEKEILEVTNVIADSDLRILIGKADKRFAKSLTVFRLTFLQYMKFLLRARVRLLTGKKIIITDSCSYGYFHWLLDCLPRLLLVLNDGERAQVILPSGMQKFVYVKDSLEFIGIKNYHFLKQGFLYYINKILFPVHLAPSGNYNDQVVKDVRRRFLKGKEKPSLKVYISRSKSGRRKIENEKEILEVLRENEFSVVFCEDMNFADQVRLFSRVKYLVTNHGAGLSNILFMVPGTKVIELRAENDSLNNCYFSLASALDLKYYYQTCLKANPAEDVHTANIIVNTAQLSNNLKLMLQDD